MYCKNFKFKKETPSSKKALALFIFSILAFANPVFAADIRISPLKSEIMFQEQFLANVVVGSEEPVNTIEGSLYFPDDLLSVSEIRTGDSVINFWVEKPHISAGGNISFSGGTPGGWSGPHNLIFSVVFEAKNNTGSASIVFGNIRAFQNDGMGTEMTLAGRSADIYIKKGNGMPTERLADHEMPEYFMPAIGEGAPVFNGKKFLVFATQDKISGVNRYEVKESWWAGYKVAESPYLLKNQQADRRIYVKAVDNSKNERVVVYIPDTILHWYQYPEFFAIIIVFAIGVCLFLLKRP